MSESLLAAQKEALDYIETNPDEHEARLLAALLTEICVLIGELATEQLRTRLGGPA